MRLTEGETRALLASTLLVTLAAVGRSLLQPAPAPVSTVGIRSAGDIDSALAVAESLYAERAHRSMHLGAEERVNVNEADERELDRLPGVGPALARSIVEDRRRNGPFNSLSDLERVPGLGSSKVARLEPHVALPTGAPMAGTREAAEAVHSGRARGAGPTPEVSHAVGRGAASRLDLNRASVSELQALPGIGPARAEAIVRWRDEHGRFRRVEDLLQVPGVGPATLERLKPLIVAGP